MGDGREGPALWAVAELADPLVARLRRHFGGQGLPTDRVDRPEWLFTTAVQLAADVSPSLVPLQPAIGAAQLQHTYVMQVHHVPPSGETQVYLLQGVFIIYPVCSPLGTATSTP